MLRFDIITLFPSIFDSPLKESILGNAQRKGIIKFAIHNLRDYALDKHKVTDDLPYGGGRGMILKIEPIVRALESIQREGEKAKIILLTPQGTIFNYNYAKELAQYQQLIIICGRYEGVDERVRENFVDEEISIGDYVLSGGEFAALVIIDAVSRYVPGVVGCPCSVDEDSFSHGLLEYPQYTRPREFRGLKVPEILLSGNHKEIEKWRRKESLKRTFFRRPDLLEKAKLSEEDLSFLNTLRSAHL